MAAAAVTLLTGSAFAADLIVSEEPVPAAGFDWQRAYFGASIAGEFDVTGSGGDTYYGGGVFAGINFLASEGFLLGLEGTADLVTDGTDSYAEFFLLGRGGVLVTPDLLAYGIAGVGYEFDIDDTSINDTAYQLGAGLEYAVSDAVTVRGQLTGYGYFDDSDLFDYARASVGVAFHF